jgi:hypothetical protein
VNLRIFSSWQNRTLGLSHLAANRLRRPIIRRLLSIKQTQIYMYFFQATFAQLRKNCVIVAGMLMVVAMIHVSASMDCRRLIAVLASMAVAAKISRRLPSPWTVFAFSVVLAAGHRLVPVYVGGAR